VTKHTAITTLKLFGGINLLIGLFGGGAILLSTLAAYNSYVGLSWLGIAIGIGIIFGGTVIYSFFWLVCMIGAAVIPEPYQEAPGPIRYKYRARERDIYEEDQPGPIRYRAPISESVTRRRP